MSVSETYLDFELPVIEIEKNIDQLKLRAAGFDKYPRDEIGKLQEKADKLRRKIFSHLSSWQILQLARHPGRPRTSSLIESICDDFIEMHGDRNSSDDGAIVGGLAFFHREPVMVIGQEKGQGASDEARRNHGMLSPAGFHKARRLLAHAELLKRPVLIFIDTPGALATIGTEQNGQARAIGACLEALLGVPVPIVAVIIGEGMGEGAMAMAAADRLLMLQYAAFSVVSPEKVAERLWEKEGTQERATQALRLTAPDLMNLGFIDEIVEEPVGGAHRDWLKTSRNIALALKMHLEELKKFHPRDLCRQRAEKYRKIGLFEEKKA